MKLKWSYDSLPHDGGCIINGEPLTVKFLFRLGKLKTPPDVLKIESWIEHTIQHPTTVEQLAQSAAWSWSMRVTVKGTSPNHGTITATFDGRRKKA